MPALVVLRCFGLMILTLLLLGGFARAEDKPPVQGGVHLFLRQHCFACHSEKKIEGEIRLDNLAIPASNIDADKTWTRVAEVITSGEMPPAEAKRPDPAAIKFVADSIATALAKSKAPRPLACGE